jgi:hypothetical protein
MIRERLEANSIPEPNSGCLLWLHGLTAAGYARLRVNGVEVYAHRLAWELANGQSIPTGMCVCHKCDVPSCINPDHLFIGTHADNMADMARKGRKVQVRGEAIGGAKLTAENVRELRAAVGTRREIAARFGISTSHLDKIRTGQKWGHI